MSKGRGNAENCSVDDCGKPAHGRGLCGAHYQRWRKTGSAERAAAHSECGICGKSFAHKATAGRWTYCSEDCRTEGRRRIYRAHREARREERAEYDRNRVRTHDWRRRDYAKLLEYARRRRARIRGSRVADFSPNQLAERLSMFGGCWICGAEASQVDHVKPIARGGPHMLANLRPICPPCNLRKHARWPLAESDIAAIRAAA